ncbi:hypothetical protein GGI08_008603, partial [Coemansia sp. S2]
MSVFDNNEIERLVDYYDARMKDGSVIVYTKNIYDSSGIEQDVYHLADKLKAFEGYNAAPISLVNLNHAFFSGSHHGFQTTDDYIYIVCFSE